MGNGRLEKKIEFIARAFVWEGRFHKARQITRTIKGHRESVRQVKDAAGWWARLLLPNEDDD